MFCKTSGAPGASLLERIQSYVTCCKIRVWTEPDSSTWEECSERAADSECAGANPARDALNSACAAVTLVAVQVQVVAVSMDLPSAIKFDDLMANPTVMSDLKGRVSQSFADAAGVHVGYVTVTFARKTSRRLDARKSSLRRLTTDGVSANAQIVAPQGQSPAAMQSALSADATKSSLATSVVDAVLATPNIESAAPGQTLSDLQNSRSAFVTAATTSMAVTTPVVPMMLDSTSPLLTAAQSNTVTTTTTTTVPTTVPAGSTTAAPTTNSTTTLPAEGVLGGGRALAAMTVSTAAAVLIAVSA